MDNLYNYISKEEINSDITICCDDQIYLTYNFFDKTYTLQCAFKDSEYVDLFSNQFFETDTYGEESRAYTVYDYENDSYFEISKIKDDIRAIVYMKSKDFDKLDRICRPSSLPLVNTFKSFRADSFVNSHSNIIYSGYGFNDTSENKILAEKCKKLYIKYEMAKNSIVSSYLLSNINSVLNHYIATRELDIEQLLSNYMILTDFSDFCHSTFPLISDFVYDPENIDCQKLSDELNKKIDNIGSLIKIYLKEELDMLENKEKGE